MFIAFGLARFQLQPPTSNVYCVPGGGSTLALVLGFASWRPLVARGSWRAACFRCLLVCGVSVCRWLLAWCPVAAGVGCAVVVGCVRSCWVCGVFVCRVLLSRCPCCCCRGLCCCFCAWFPALPGSAVCVVAVVVSAVSAACPLRAACACSFALLFLVLLPCPASLCLLVAFVLGFVSGLALPCASLLPSLLLVVCVLVACCLCLFVCPFVFGLALLLSFLLLCRRPVCVAVGGANWMTSSLNKPSRTAVHHVWIAVCTGGPPV